MEQDIRCKNHPDKNAIRLCDGCSIPFCAECLRKNLLGFYYCQRCYPKLIRGISIGFGVFLFNFIILYAIFGGYLSYFEWSILGAFITYFLAGLSCGIFWPENSWRWGFWLTIPYGFAVILLIMFYVLETIKIGSTLGEIVSSLSILFILNYFVLVLISSTGAYVGVRIGAKSNLCATDKNQNNK